MVLLGAVKKIGAGMLKGRKKKQTGAVSANKVTGNSVKANPNATLDAKKVVPAATSAENISKSAGGSKFKTVEEAALKIKITTIEVNTLLKGSLALDKMQEANKKKTQQELKRTKAEKDLEKDNKGKFSLPIPGAQKVKSLWQRIQDFFLKIFWGFLAVRLLPLLPKIAAILPAIGNAAEWFIGLGIGFIDALGTALKVGYDAYDKTKEWVKDKFGEDSAEKFDSFMGLVNKVINLTIALALGAASFGGKKPKGPKPKQPKRNIKNRLKRTKKLFKRRFDPKRAEKLKRVKNIKKIRADKLARTKKFGNLRKIAKAKKFVGKTTQAAGKTTQAVSKNVGKVTKAVSKTSQAVGKNISKVSGKVSQSAGKIVTRLGMKMNTGMVQSMKGLSKMAKGVRIPIVGPILAALTSYLAEGKWDKALFIGVGTALGELLGSLIPIPVIGTLLGGAIGFYIGDLLYTLFRGGGVAEVGKKLQEDLKKMLSVGKAIFDWSKLGLGRLIEGLPKIGAFGVKAPNPAWLLNPLNMVDKAKLIGKAFFSKDPMVEEKKKEETTQTGSTTMSGEELEAAETTDTTLHTGGLVPVDTSAYLQGGEIVIDVDSAGPAKDMLLAINQANSYEGIVEAIRKFAPYEALEPETIVVSNPVAEVSQIENAPSQSSALPIVIGGDEDPYETLDFFG